MVVPPYCRARDGRVFRIVRSSRMVAFDRQRFALRAQPIRCDDLDLGIELVREIDADYVRDKIAHGQAVPTPEVTFEDLWHELCQAIDAHAGE
jgi:hypothetical protein